MRGIFAVTDPLHDLPKDRLEALSQKIEAAKPVKDEETHMKKDYSQANQAWRMVTELVAGLLIGFLLGYGLDILFGTIPIFLVTFTLLGLAAGIKTMIATAQELAEKMAQPSAEDEDETRGD